MQKTCFNTSALNSQLSMVCESDMYVYCGTDKLLFHHLGERYCLTCVHMLLHLTDAVRNLGPLWATSCFPFESMNGQLTRMFHGTRQPHMQVLWK